MIVRYSVNAFLYHQRTERLLVDLFILLSIYPFCSQHFTWLQLYIRAVKGIVGSLGKGLMLYGLHDCGWSLRSMESR